MKWINKFADFCNHLFADFLLKWVNSGPLIDALRQQGGGGDGSDFEESGPTLRLGGRF